MRGFTIGELARRTGVSRDTLRFYEREHLIPPPHRTSARYRVYSDEDVKRVSFIRQARAIGFTLEDIRELLKVRHLRTTEECGAVAERIRARMSVLDDKITRLEAFRCVLSQALARCEEAEDGACPVVLDLGGSPRASAVN